MRSQGCRVCYNNETLCTSQITYLVLIFHCDMLFIELYITGDTGSSLFGPYIDATLLPSIFGASVKLAFSRVPFSDP